MQPTRRAFLMGRRPPRSPWSAFIQRLRLLCSGRVDDVGEAAGTGHGRLAPAGPEDVRQARGLCAEYGVVLGLSGGSPADAAPGRSILWVDPVNLNQLHKIDGPQPRWHAEPGVTLDALVQAGLGQFAQAPPPLTLAQWLAQRRYAAWPTGRIDLSGIHSADVLFADGVTESLGPFGAEDGQPLRSVTVQRLVPSLFMLSTGADGRWCRAQDAWPARYRLDALDPTPPAGVNLAHLLHGHGGTLAWVEGVVLRDTGEAGGKADRVTSAENEVGASPAARALDARIKALFDPLERYPAIPPDA
jgi:hypothetical protein